MLASICGWQLVGTFCRLSGSTGWHSLRYGSPPQVPLLAKRLTQKCVLLRVPAPMQPLPAAWPAAATCSLQQAGGSRQLALRSPPPLVVTPHTTW
jgi:hypothetical protein